MAATINVGVLRALLTADTAQFTAGMRTASESTKKTVSSMDAMTRGMSQAAKQSASSIQMIGGMSQAGRDAAANLAKVTTATDGAAQGIKRFGLSVDQVKGALGAFGLTLGVSAVASFGRELLATADNLVKVADRTGLTTTEVQKLQYIAGQSGNSIDELTGAVSRLQNNLVSGDKGAVAAVKALGINLQELRAANPFDQMEMVATAIAKVPDPATRAAIAIDLFGRTGAQILPTLISNFKQLGDEAPVMSDKTVRALEQAGDALNRAKLQMTVWAAEAFNFAGTLFDRFVIVIRRGAASLSEAMATLASGLSKLPLIGAPFDTLAKKLRADAQLLRDGANATEAALKRQDTEIRKNTGAVVDYDGAITGSTKKTKAAASEVDKAAAAHRAFINELGVREIEDAAAALSAMADQARAYRGFLNQIGEQEIRDHEARNADIAKQDTALRAIQNDLGVAEIEAERDKQGQLKEIRQKSIEFWKQQIGQLESATVGQLGNLFFGNLGHDINGELKSAAQEAELDFLKIQRSGKATAQELETAFERWRDAEDRANLTFGERWKQFWNGLKQTFVSILNDMLSFFLKSFLGGLIKGMFSAKLAQNLGNALMGGTAGAGLGGVGALLGGGGALTAGTVSNGVLVGVGAGGVAGAAPAGAAAGAGGGGLLALATNPFTIGAAAGIGLGLAIWKGGLFRGGWEGTKGNERRDQFVAQWGPPGTGPESGFSKLAAFLTAKTGEEGGGRLFRDLMSGDKDRYESSQAAIVGLAAQSGKKVQQFQLGGLVKGFGAMPAIVHGGEGILTMAGMRNLGGEPALQAINTGAVGPPNMTINNFDFHIQGWDGVDITRAIHTQVIPKLKQALTLNTGLFGSAVANAGVS